MAAMPATSVPVALPPAQGPSEQQKNQHQHQQQENHQLDHHHAGAAVTGGAHSPARQGGSTVTAAAEAVVAQARPVQPVKPDQPLTSDQIQGKLDENAVWIKTIVDCQNAKRFDVALQYQERLQTSLMHLASIADAQQPPVAPAPGGSVPQVPAQPARPQSQAAPRPAAQRM